MFPTLTVDKTCTCLKIISGLGHHDLIIWAARKSYNHKITTITMISGMHYDFWPLPFFCVTLTFNGLCTKSAQCSFSDANLALQLMATFNAMRLRLRLVYKLTQLKFIFLQFDNFFSYFHSILIPYEYSGLGTTVLYYFIDMHYGSQTVTREATVNTERHGFTTVFHFSSKKLPRFCGFFTVIFLQPYLHYMH